MADKLPEYYLMMGYVDWWRGRDEDFVHHFAEYIRGIDSRRAIQQPIKEAV